MGLVSNCGHDEYGRYSYGQAGDQTGTEWELRSWYNYPWDYVLRHPDSNVAAMISTLAVEAAKNDKIGYDQAERHTFWQHLQASNFHPKNITVACEADCSSGVAAIVKAVGFLLNRPELRNVSADCWTGNLRQVLTAAGFIALGGSEYLASDAHLKKGDILLNTQNHVCTYVGDGGEGDDSVHTVNLIQIKNGDNGVAVLLLQEILKSRGFKGKDKKELALDRSFGADTEYALKQYQKERKLKADGVCGPQSWTDLLGM